MRQAKKLKNTFRTDAHRLIRDPLFFFRVNQKLAEAGIIGEQKNGLILFLAGVTKDLEKPVSVLEKGASSTGKSELLKAVISLFPAECVLSRASLSAKAPVHGAGDLTGKILYITEYRGAAADALYLTRLLQSEGTIAHEYATVTGAKRGTAVATRKGTPVVLSTTTERRVFEDDETRFLSIRADDSPEQTQSVIAAHFSPVAERARGNNIRVWHEAIRLIGKGVPTFVHPGWFDLLAKNIPPGEPRARRDAVRFLSLLKAVALCRSFSDGRRKKSEKRLNITLGDYCVAHTILASAFSSTFAGAHPRALELAAAVAKLNRIKGRAVTVKELAASLNWDASVAYKYVKEAEADRLVEYEPGYRQWNLKRLLPGIVSQPGFLPDPNLILQTCKQLPNEVSYVDPLTGEVAVLKRSRWCAEEVE